MLDFHSNGLQLAPPQQEDVRFLVMSCLAVGVGSRLGPHLRSQASLKGVAHGIKLADGFMKSARTIHKLCSPTLPNLVSLALEAAKAVAKGASKGLVVKDMTPCFKKLFKGLKASEGALNLVKYSNVLNYGAADPLELVIKGYKLTKSAFNVLDGVHGVRSSAAAGYGGFKEGMEGVGVVVKAMVLYKQTHGFLIQGLRVSHDLWEALRNDTNEERRSKAKMQKRGGRQRRIFGLPRGNPCRLRSDKNLGLRNLLEDGVFGHGNAEHNLESVLCLSLPCRPDHLCR